MLNIRKLSPDLQKKAIKELNEDPKRLASDVEAFRSWIKKSPHLKGRIDDQFLVNFLRGCKFSLEKAKQKYDLFYTLKAHMTAFRNRDPLDEKNKFNLQHATGILLPKSKIPGSPRFFIVRPGDMDTTKMNADDVLKNITFFYETLMLDDDDFVVSGVVTVGDQQGVTLKHVAIYNGPLPVKKMLTVVQDAFPIRQKGMHVFNMPHIMVSLFNLVKSFLNKKNKSKFQIHDSIDKITNIIPKDILPSEYGGKAGSLNDLRLNNFNMIAAHRDYFLEDDQYGVDEKKRPGKPKSQETLFGVDGTFRKLEID